MNVAQHKIINLPFSCSSVFISVCVFNMWPKTTLLSPVGPRDAKRLDAPECTMIYSLNALLMDI